MLHVACCRLMAHKLLWNSQQSNRSAKPTVRQHRRLRTAQNSSQHATSSDPWTYLPLELVALLADEPLVRQPREHGRRPSGAVLACGRLTAAAPMCLPTMATVGHRCDAAGPHECATVVPQWAELPTYVPVAILGRERRAETRHVRREVLGAIGIAPECHLAAGTTVRRTGAIMASISHSVRSHGTRKQGVRAARYVQQSQSRVADGQCARLLVRWKSG
jgi:hypothetical protein